jgi:prophage regulatory protein
MRLFAGLIPHSHLSGRTLAAADTNSTGFVSACAVTQTVKGCMKNISYNSSEQLNDILPKSGFVRLRSILAPDGPIPVGRSTWWAGVKSGRFPKPVKLGPRTTAWRVDDIRVLIDTAR